MKTQQLFSFQIESILFIMSNHVTPDEDNQEYAENFFRTSLLNAEDQFKFDILMAGQEAPLKDLDLLTYKFSYYRMDSFVRLALDCNGALDIYIKANPESPTNLEIGVGIRFCHPDRSLCNQFRALGETEPKSSIARFHEPRPEGPFRSALDYVDTIIIPNLETCKLLAIGFDSIEQEDDRVRMGVLLPGGKVAGQISSVKALSKKYRFWRGFIELLIHFSKFDSKSSNRLASGVISRSLIYLAFMYYVQNALLTLAYRDTPDQTWEHILGVRNLIIQTFKPLNEDTPQTISDLNDFRFLYGPPFDGYRLSGEPTLRNLSEYHGRFWNGLSLSHKEEFFQYYDDFFAGKYPAEERPLEFYRAGILSSFDDETNDADIWG